MPSRSRALLLVPALLLTACAEGEPTAPRAALRPEQASASACHAVRFTSVGTPQGGGRFAAALSGDLEGTLVTTFDFSTVEITGATIANAGTSAWTITGGVVPGLTAFTTAFENRNLDTDRPGSPATRFENHGRHRATGGVALANLTYDGVFTAVPSPVVTLHWSGVICP